MEINIIDTTNDVVHVITVNIDDSFTDVRRYISEATGKRPRCFDMYYAGDSLQAENEDTDMFIEVTGMSPGDNIDIGSAHGELIDDVKNGKSLEGMQYYVTELEDVVSEACRRDGSQLAFAAPKLRDNAIVVDIAVRQFGCALQFASDRLRGTAETVLAAVCTDHRSIFYATNSARQDYSIIHLAVEQNGFSLGYAPPALRNDRPIVERAVTNCGLSLRYVSNELRADEGIISKAVDQEPSSIKYANSSVLKKDFLSRLKEELGETKFDTLRKNLPFVGKN